MVDKVVSIARHPAGAALMDVAGDEYGAVQTNALTPVAGVAESTTDVNKLAKWEIRLGELLTNQEKIRKSDLSNVIKMRLQLDEVQSLSSLLVKLGMVSAADMANALKDVLKLPLAKRSDYFDSALLELKVSSRFLHERSIVPIGCSDDYVHLAMSDPSDQFAVKAIQLACGRRVKKFIGTRSDIEQAISNMDGDDSSEPGARADQLADTTELDVAQLKDMASEAPVIRLVNVMLQRATELCASDIHIEPFDGHLKIRFRVDGILQDIDAPPVNLAAAVISRLKIMANLDIAERRLPQDGRLKLRLNGRDLDVRVSTVPTMHGESVVLRLLNRDAVTLELKSLGLHRTARQKFREVLSMPHGMILVTGPTGSGKTTTLYTALNILNTQERKIITAEDPVEYQIDGINQIQIQPAIGLTFANVLRSIVRQDPDVILVGEMRDLETARICVQSALTGHLLLSTLHTNSAASSITRLIEMGVEDYLLTSTLNAIVSQRLVRVLCEQCRSPYTPSEELLQKFNFEPTAAAHPPTLYRPAGCEHCQGTGYAGRTAIAETLVMTDTVRDCVIRQADARQIADAAVVDGMTTIWQDGCRKAFAGITSVEEVARVVHEA